MTDQDDSYLPHRTRVLMAAAVDKSLEQNIQYIQHLIDKLQGLQAKLREGAELVKAEIGGHYTYAAEALGFVDQIEERFAGLENGGLHDREDAQAGQAAAATDRDTGGDGDEPEGGVRTGAPVVPGGAGIAGDAGLVEDDIPRL